MLCQGLPIIFTVISCASTHGCLEFTRIVQVRDMYIHVDNFSYGSIMKPTLSIRHCHDERQTDCRPHSTGDLKKLCCLFLKKERTLTCTVTRQHHYFPLLERAGEKGRGGEHLFTWGWAYAGYVYSMAVASKFQTI